MSNLMRSVLTKRIIQNPLLQYIAVRNHWNKDFKPAKYPETEQEKLAAAKKYYLLPEEYKPYANDGLGQGDYPKLDDGLGVENKDSYYPYDFPEHKRNFNEPLSADYNLYSEDRYSQAEKPRYSSIYYLSCFLGVMTFSFLLYGFLEDKKMFRPVLPKQYPGSGEKHYTFD
ncbi:NDUFB8 family protein [Megaselia abdita]